jgi:hypothetical protein
MTDFAWGVVSASVVWLALFVAISLSHWREWGRRTAAINKALHALEEKGKK